MQEACLVWAVYAAVAESLVYCAVVNLLQHTMMTVLWWTHPDDVIGGTLMTAWPWFFPFFYTGRLIKSVVILRIVWVLQTHNRVRLCNWWIISYIWTHLFIIRGENFITVALRRWYINILMRTTMLAVLGWASHAKIFSKPVITTHCSHGSASTHIQGLRRWTHSVHLTCRAHNSHLLNTWRTFTETSTSSPKLSI